MRCVENESVKRREFSGFAAMFALLAKAPYQVAQERKK